ncbi:MAG TPA: OHCU decarboxylase, partial [Chitinophagaceae bacterium]|nr:OHCU decarboxylase [Chitinophagaceae bacterium]
MTLHDLHTLSPGEAASLLSGACGSSTWLNRLMEYFPFTSLQEMLRASEKIWYQDCGEPDWLEAFSHHPKIGDIKSLSEKFASTSHLAGKEQSAVAEASEEL